MRVNVYLRPGHISQTIDTDVARVPQRFKEPAPTKGPERHLVGDRGHFIEAHITGNDGRIKWAIHDEPGALLALVWGRDEAEKAVAELVETGAIVARCAR